MSEEPTMTKDEIRAAWAGLINMDPLVKFAQFADAFFGGDCVLDHHGYCQEHSYFDSPCVVEVFRASQVGHLLRAMAYYAENDEAPAPTETAEAGET